MSVKKISGVMGSVIACSLAIAFSLALYFTSKTPVYAQSVNRPTLLDKTVERLDSEGNSERHSKGELRSGLASKLVNQAETPEEAEDRLLNAIVHLLRDRFGNDTSATTVKIEMIAFSKELLDIYPTLGEELFESSIRTAFPEMSQVILEVVASMDQYNLWLLDNIWELNNLSVIERDGKIWEKRTELFGELAKDIWSEELTSSEDRKATVQETLDILETAYQTSMDERLHILTSTLEESYANTLENRAIDKALISNMFFGLNSVQRELASLDHTARQQRINSVRERLGFSEDEIRKMTTLDSGKALRWENGLRYMMERKSLEETFQGDELDNMLERLQGDFFPRDAETIRIEEKRNFYRYHRPRIYGRN